MGPSSKILASRSDSGLGRTNGSGLARAVSVYGCLRDLRESEVPGRASDGAMTATDVVFEREHQRLTIRNTSKTRALGCL